MSNNVTILAGIGMVCGTILGGLYITRKDNVKLVDKIYEPLNKLADCGVKYIEHEMKQDDLIELEYKAKYDK